MDDQVMVTIGNLTRPEFADLKDGLKEHVVGMAGGDTEPSKLGALDPYTVSFVIAGASLPAFAMFLLKNRRGPRIYRSVKISRSNGTVEERVLDIDLGHSEADPEVVKASSPTFRTVVSMLEQVFGGGTSDGRAAPD